MKVSELINRLKDFPQDLMVVVSGYEGGVNDVTTFEECVIKRDINTEWYYGKHEIIYYPGDVENNALELS